MTIFELQTNTWVDGWVNVSLTEDEHGNTTPLVFETREDAQKELDDMRDEIERQVLSGEREPDEVDDWEGDWRIVEKKSNNKHENNTLLRLWDLAEQWTKLADGWTQPQGYSLAINEAAKELKNILNNFENNSCDCTAGVEHIHILD